MVVCHCREVTDHDVLDALASGATDLPTLSRRCGAARRCGGCRPALRRLLAERSPTLDDRVPVAAAGAR